MSEPHLVVDYAYALAECRRCLAALADQSPYELSVAYERLLLLLDTFHGDDVPALEPIDGDPGEVWVRLVVAMDRLVRLSARGSDETIVSWCGSG